MCDKAEPVWTTADLSACLHMRGAPAFWSPLWRMWQAMLQTHHLHMVHLTSTPKKRQPVVGSHLWGDYKLDLHMVYGEPITTVGRDITAQPLRGLSSTEADLWPGASVTQSLVASGYHLHYSQCSSPGIGGTNEWRLCFREQQGSVSGSALERSQSSCVSLGELNAMGPGFWQLRPWHAGPREACSAPTSLQITVQDKVFG